LSLINISFSELGVISSTLFEHVETNIVGLLTRSKLDSGTALKYATILRTNILGKDKQEKVNSIVVLAKLLDCILGTEAVSNDYVSVFDNVLVSALFCVVSINMSTETYKSILKITVVLISGGIFPQHDITFENYLPLYETLIDCLDVIDIITQKLYLQDNKITYNSIKLVTDLINQALVFEYSGIITIAARLKHVKFFSTVGNLIETDDQVILDAIDNLQLSYFNLNENLNYTKFNMSIKSHQIMLNNLFSCLEVALNENGTSATPEEYVRAGFTANPKKFILENYSILSAMNLKVFLKDPNFTFKKRYQEELMMKGHGHTFPIGIFIEKCSAMWLDVIHNPNEYPYISNSVLSWELMIYASMNSSLIIWLETEAELGNQVDVEKIIVLLLSNVYQFEQELAKHDKSIEDCLEVSSKANVKEMRHDQVAILKKQYAEQWRLRFNEFDKNLRQEVLDFVAEQRVIQLLKGSWVYTEAHGEQMLSKVPKNLNIPVYYYITLSPNRQQILFKEYADKPVVDPNYDELEDHFVRLSDIAHFESSTVGQKMGDDDKRKNTMLISIRGTISYEKITLLDAKKKKLLSFYTDTEVNKFVWLDGLKMLKGMNKPGQISEDTAKQIDSLIEIRSATQLLTLEDEKLGGVIANDEDSDDEFYDLAQLSKVTKDFHYL